jgi:hypothetical protein
MPTFDGGHYFLTVLAPIRTDTLPDGVAQTSPVHALRKRLDMLATAQTAAHASGQSPFAKNTRNHFVRLVIIDDVAYNGRDQAPWFVNLVTGDNPVIAQPQDHLSCPFLLLAVDFDAASGADSERDSYFAELWSTMGDDLRAIFGFCHDFDRRVTDARSFAKYMADCQLETTMSFNDYYADTPILPEWSAGIYKWGLLLAGGALALGLAATLILLVAQLFAPPMWPGLRYAVAVTLIGVAAVAVVAFLAYLSLMRAGAKPFPTAADSNLPGVLKALHLQRAFTRFAIDNQMLAVGSDAASAQKLCDNFLRFVADNKPNELGDPTQAAGVIGI